MAPGQGVLVTGSSRGVGLGLCTALAERGQHVIATCRNASSELRALDVTIVEGIDVSSDEVMPRLARAVEGTTLTAVICNAGINISAGELEDFDTAAAMEEFQVNALGAVRTVLALLPSLDEGSKVMLVSTGRGSLGRTLNVPGHHGYRMSKGALNTFGFSLAHDLADRGVAVVLVNPGPCETDTMREIRERGGWTLAGPDEIPTALEAARMLCDRLDELDMGSTGRYLEYAGDPVDL